MHRIDGPGATVDNKFTKGDPVSAIPATQVTDDWLNSVQEEISAVILSAGLTLNKANNAQLLAAITQKITSAIPAYPPAASTSVAGIVELATNLETQDGTDTTRAVTSAGLTSKIQPTTYNTTAARIMATGAFGLGSTYSDAPLLATDINGAQLTGSGIYRYTSSTTGKPGFGSGFGSLDHRAVTMDGGGNYATQLAIDYASNNIGFRRLSGSSGWQPWNEIYHTGNLVQATEAANGIAAVATQTLTNAGVNDTAFVTPKKLRFGFQFLAAANGYLVFPTWMGGFIIQWGTATIPNTTTNVSYPMTYPTAQLATVATARGASAGLDGVEINAPTTTSFPAAMVSASGSAVQIAGTFSWISCGY